ncbi:MAG: sigma-70 family RNA polymerase sigma factor [Bacteroidales bacterium]|nr:sigma-70 family RNA polymerase sigma factor [Bacteroidales bacterium]
MRKVIQNNANLEHTEVHKDVIEKCRKGDARAQYELYQLYARSMYNICLRMMQTREAAEDLLQEAFSDAFGKLDTFRFDSGFGSWLKRIVINHCINEINRRKTDLEFFDDMVMFESEDETEDQEYENQLSVENVKRALVQLPEGSRLIFSLYLLEGYDHTEISEILSISESNSKSQYMRAKRRIKEILLSGGGNFNEN